MSSEQEFREKFLKCKTPSEISDLVIRYATKPTDFASITVPVPDSPGSTITYQVMKGYISAGGYPVPVDASTAQYLANKWGMQLPTSKMIDQITKESAKTGGLIKVTPLSASGTTIGSKSLSPLEISNTYLANPEVIDNHNRLVEEYIRENGISSDSIMIGDQKVLILPESGSTDKTHFKGFIKSIDKKTGKIEFFQSGNGPSPHPAQGHFEYCLKAKLVKNNMTVDLKDEGSKEMSFAEVLADDLLAPAISYKGSSKSVATYKAKPVDKKESEDKEDKEEPAKATHNQKEKKDHGAIEKLTDWVSEKASGAKKYLEENLPSLSEKIKSIFSQAEEFELTAYSELFNIQIQKTSSLKKEIGKKDVSRKNRNFNC